MKRVPDWTRRDLVLPVSCLVLGLMARLILIWAVPGNYSFDAYQRWAGRDHLFIQDWLPLTQSILVGNEAVGGGLTTARMALALVAACGMAMAAVVARRLGGETAGWCFVPLSMFGPALCWTVVPYQEGTYLALLMGGLALSLAARDAPEKRRLRLAADLLIGATALCRTEGWPLVLLYLIWWRDLKSLRALWAVGLWVGWKWGIGFEPHRPSPVDYADWEGLRERFEWSIYGESLVKHLRHWAQSGGWLLWGAGVVGAVRFLGEKRRAEDPVRTWGLSLLTMILVAQVASTLAWMVGLETATRRMMLVPGLILAVFGALALGAWLPRLPRLPRRLGELAVVGIGIYFVADGLSQAQRAGGMRGWERALVQKMEKCEDCYVQVRPRKGLGTRNRHDGCEVIQGITDWRHPADFHCATWPEPPTKEPTHQAQKKGKGYILRPQ